MQLMKHVSKMQGIRLCAVVFAVCLLGDSSAFGASLSDYRTRVESALVATDDLLQRPDLDNPVALRNGARRIATSIPSSERIEWPGGDVETQNQWLTEALVRLESASDVAERSQILTEISERLSGILESVAALESAAATAASKDEEKQKLAEILRRDEYQKPKPAEQSLFQKWLDQFLDWLARAFPRSPITPSTATSGVGSLQFWLQIIIYGLVIGLIGFLVYKFAPLLFTRSGSRDKADRGDRVILGERVAADESASNLFAEAESLARDGHLREAIRKGYIALLCDLSDRKIVRLSRHKTNRDYLRDVRKDKDLHTTVSGLTRNFETNWYGLRPADEADWEDFRTKYRTAVGGRPS
ncbi:MAG: DUF4129 domain-containing protein [Pyrinomonadaceae bacterium]